MQVSGGGYYAWRKRRTQPPSVRRRKTAQLIRDCFWDNRRRYGTRRIAAELRREGERIGRGRIRAVMREENWRAIQPKRFVPKTTNSQHGKLASPNLLSVAENQPLTAASVIIGDITRFATSEWRMVLSGDLAGQADAARCGMGSGGANDGRFSHPGV